MPGTEPAPGWHLVCRACRSSYPFPSLAWRCACGGGLDLIGPPPAVLCASPAPWSLWRYAPTLPPLDPTAVTMGEGGTPLVDLGPDVAAKVDFANPTLSFKDRGAVLVIAAALAAGARSVVVDSSGNAGVAVAAYAARAGLTAEVWVPAGTSSHKVSGALAHGATVQVVDGDRSAAAAAAVARVTETGAFYASHVHQAAFAHGVKTWLLEVFEQRGGTLPDRLVLPVGNGTLVLGAALAVADLRALGLIDRAPRLLAVQARRCAPLAGLAPDGPTLAEGIAIPEPPRGAEVLGAVEASGGRVVTVSETAIVEAQTDLAHRGLWVEPTAAVAWAAHRADPAPGDATVLLLCGAGLKSAT